MNQVARGVMEKILGVPVPQEGDGLSYTCPLGVEVEGIRGKSFQSLLSSLPIKCRAEYFYQRSNFLPSRLGCMPFSFHKFYKVIRYSVFIHFYKLLGKIGGTVLPRIQRNYL